MPKKKKPASPGGRKPPRPSSEPGAVSWTFLTNHAHVLLLLARDSGLTMREAAAAVGITERAVQRIVLDLESAGYLVREKEGRRNRYQVRPDRPLRHPIESHQRVAALIALLDE
jgi:predicted ArsR family transcriptional regulator